jgi:hypothetical protein
MMLKPFCEFLETIRSDLTDLEEQRVSLHKKYLQGWMIVGLILLGGAGATIAALASGSTPVGIVVGIASIITMLVVGYYKIGKPHSQYVQLFKARFIGAIASGFGDGLAYDPAGCIPREVYLSSQLFTRDPDRYAGEDLLEGRIGQTGIRMSELHSEYKTTSTDSKGNTQTRWHTIFKGLFIEADFHKNFQGRTFVRPDFAEKAFGFIGRAMQKVTFSDAKLVQLEDKDFEKVFVVNSTDQVEARYILSTSMMRRMLEMQKRFNADTSFAFVNSSMFIAVSIKENLFEPTFSRSVLDDEYLKKYYEQFGGCVQIVEDLGLNIRIWGKE